MSDNPLETTPEREAAIEARAKALREDAGGVGDMAEYRERADELIRMEMSGTPGQLPIEDGSPIPGVVVEEASVQENYGELPGARGVADQGEWRETPMTREELRRGGDEQPGRGDAP